MLLACSVIGESADDRGMLVFCAIQVSNRQQLTPGEVGAEYPVLLGVRSVGSVPRGFVNTALLYISCDFDRIQSPI